MGSGSKGSTVQNTSSQPPPEVMEEYRKLIERGNLVGSQPYQQYGGQMVAPMSQEQLAAIGGINNAQDIAQPYFDTARGYGEAGAAPITAEDLARYQNPYQQQVVNATLGNLNLLNKQQQAGLEGSVMGSGGLFNDRFGVAQSQLAGQQATAEAPTIAGLESAGFNTALSGAQADRAARAQAAYTFGNLGTANLSDILQGRQAQYGAGTAEQQLAQRYLDVPYQQFQQQQAFPYQQLSWLAQIGAGLGSNMGGTSTSTTTPPKPWYQFWKDGGGIKGYDGGGGIGGLSPYPYGGAQSYIPGVTITHGSGPPKPAGAAQTKAQDPFGDISKVGKFTGLDKKAGSMFDINKQGSIPDLMGMGDPSEAEAQQDARATGSTAEEVGLGTSGGGEAAAGAEGGLDLSALFSLFALKDGGGIKGRRGYAPGGDIDSADLPSGDDDTVLPDEAPLVPSRVSPEAGLGDLARAPVSGDTTRAGLSMGLSRLDPTGLAARQSGAPLWPGETTAPPKPPSSYPGMAGQVAEQWRGAGASENATKGVLYNINAESGFRPDSRHPDQPRFSGEAHYAHGMYQHGGNQWTGLDRYAQQNGADWRDPRTQTAYEIENLKRTNPDVWRRMNEAPTWQDAAKIYARWLAPKKEYLDQREANIDRSSDPLHGYTGAEAHLPPNATMASGRAEDAGVRVRSASDGEGNGETTTTRGGLGRLFTADNALRFGLAMLANPTPYIGTAIGQAGLATLGASQEQERYGAGQAMEERKFKLDEKTKNARVKQIDDLYEYHKAQGERATARDAERVKRDQDIRDHQIQMEKQAAENAQRQQRAAEEREKEGKFEFRPDTVADPNTGEMVEGNWVLDTRRGTTEFRPGKQLPPAKPVPAGVSAVPPPSLPTEMTEEDHAAVNSTGRNPAYMRKLQKESPNDAPLVEQIVNYKLDPSKLSNRAPAGGGLGPRERLLAEAANYTNNGYDQRWYSPMQTAIKEFTTGGPNSPAGQMTAGNTAILHAGEMSDAIENMKAVPGLLPAIGSSGIPFVSYAANQLNNRAIAGTPAGVALNEFMVARGHFAEEVTRFYSGGGGSEAERERALRNIDQAKSLPELQAAMRQEARLMKDKVNVLQQRWHTAMNGPNGLTGAMKDVAPDFPLIQKGARDALKKLDDRAAAVSPATAGGAGGGSGTGAVAPPAAAIQMLKGNPALKGVFDQKYGAGAADRILGAP